MNKVQKTVEEKQWFSPDDRLLYVRCDCDGEDVSFFARCVYDGSEVEVDNESYDELKELFGFYDGEWMEAG